MAIVNLHYEFEKTDIKNSSYSPRAHCLDTEARLEIALQRRITVGSAYGKTNPIPISFMNLPQDESKLSDSLGWTVGRYDFSCHRMAGRVYFQQSVAMLKHDVATCVFYIQFWKFIQPDYAGKFRLITK